MLEIKDMERDYTKPTREAVVLIIVVTLLILSGLLYYANSLYLKSKSIGVVKVPVENKESIKPDTFSPDAQLNYLSARSNLKTLDTKESTVISSKKLPVQVINILSVGQNIQAKSVVFVDGKKGYQVTFDIEKKLVESFMTLTQSLDRKVWNMTKASYTDRAGVVNIESANYIATINLVQALDTKTEVEMNVIIK